MCCTEECVAFYDKGEYLTSFTSEIKYGRHNGDFSKTLINPILRKIGFRRRKYG
jgi:hypothetical protein